MKANREPPSDDELSAYLLGKFSVQQSNEFEERIEQTNETTQRMLNLNPHDQLTELLGAVSGIEKDAAWSLWQNSTSSPQSPTDSGKSLPADLPGTQNIEIEALDPPAFLVSHPRYRVRRLLGAGGMGRVWLAQHTVMGRDVALKVMRSSLLSNRAAVERFLREVQASAKLCHPNIASAYDAEKIEDAYVLVMEYVPGETLSKLVRERPMAIHDACQAIRDAAAGLDHAHSAGLIHRDVKPGNLIRTPGGPVKVLDFGLVFSRDTESSITGDDLVMGTPDYISPEQAEDAHTADARSDIYSLGCTMYHLLSGRPPFSGASVLQKIDSHRRSCPTVVESIPHGLSEIMARMMARNPEDRFQSASEVVLALQSWCQVTEPAPIEPVNVTQRASTASFSPYRVLGLFGILTFALTLAVVALRFGDTSKQHAVAKSEETSGRAFRFFSLRNPTSFAAGSQSNLVIENDVLHLKTMDLDSQVWMNYQQVSGTDLEFRCRLQVHEIEQQGFLKFAFLADSGAEVDVLLSAKEHTHKLKVEKWDTGATTLIEEPVSNALGKKLTELRISLTENEIVVWVDSKRRLQCQIVPTFQRYFAIAAMNTDVDLHDPLLGIR